MTSHDDRNRSLSDPDLESLLARGHLPDKRRERIIGNVLANLSGETVAAGARRRRGLFGRRPWRLSYPLLATVVTAALVLVRFHQSPSVSEGDFQSRGGGGSSSAGSLEVDCSGGPLERCPIGSTLLFRTHYRGASPAYLVAYAESQTPGRERIWYLSGSDAPEISASGAPVVVGRGVRLGPEHRPGRYLVHLLVLDRRLDSASVVRLSAGTPLVSTTARLNVVGAPGADR